MFKAIIFILLSIPIGLIAFIITWISSDLKLGLIVGLSFFCFLNLIGFSFIYFQKSITTIDIFLPIPIAIIWSFFLSFFSFGANIFYIPAVIGSSVLLTICLVKQKQAPTISRQWLILPALVFIYEMLPINIPGPIDDYLAFSSASIVTVLGCLIKPKIKN